LTSRPSIKPRVAHAGNGVSPETIARALGLRRSGREFTGKCPSCGYASGFTITERAGALLWHCHAGGCSQSEVWASLQQADLAPRQSEHQALKLKRPIDLPQSRRATNTTG
jgi:hypothetical protein